MKLSRKFTFILIGFFSIIILVGVYFFTQPVSSVKTVKAPDFSYTLLSGKKVKLSDYLEKRPVILNFWASWCPPCRAEAPVLSKVSKEYKGKVQFLGVVVNDTVVNAKKFEKEFGITYPSGLDNGTAIGNTYQVTGVPETFFITKNGEVIEHWIGAIDEKTLTTYLNRLLNN